MDGLGHVLTAPVGCLVVLEGKNLQATEPHPQYVVYDEEASHSFDEYFHLKNFQSGELLYQRSIIQLPVIAFTRGIAEIGLGSTLGPKSGNINCLLMN